jgi:hypothetical protein
MPLIRYIFGRLLLPHMCWIKSSGHCAILCGEIEGRDPIRSVRALQHLRMAKRADRIVVAGLPFQRSVRDVLSVDYAIPAFFERRFCK